MTPKEKAQELTDKFKCYVHGYIGSSMLSNHEYPDQIVSQAKNASLIVVNEIINMFDRLHKPEYCSFDSIGERGFTYEGECTDRMTGYDMADYWEEVKLELEKP